MGEVESPKQKKKTLLQGEEKGGKSEDEERVEERST